MPKTTTAKRRRRRIVDPVLGQSSKTAHDPLGQQIVRDEEASKYAATKGTTTSSRAKHDDDNDDDDDGGKRADTNQSSSSNVLDNKSSQRILEMSREQRLEEERIEEIRQRRQRQRSANQAGKHKFEGGGSRRRSDKKEDNASSDSDDDNSNDDNEQDENENEQDDDEWIRHDDQGYVSVVIDRGHDNAGTSAAVDSAAMSQEDLDLIESMMNPSSERRTLADMILDKIDERQKEMQHPTTSAASNKNNDNDDEQPDLPPKVVHVYTEIGKMLSRYTAGKLPKAFKVIPSLSNWQDVLWLTRPDLWTPQAMYAATRIFASNLNPKMAQQFYQLVLLDAVRNDIHFNKKLNYHYYMSLKKSIYKPAAFFKGILLPLVEPDADGTLREAIIVASVLQRVSIPVHHAAVAIHKLAQSSSTASKSDPHASTVYSGPVSIFLRVLLNKKYSLPAPVIDSVVAYFGSFLRPTRVLSSGGGTTASGDDVLPVLWHQALLVFVQRYKDEIKTSVHAMQQIKLVMKRHYHPKLTPEIRRELVGGQQAYKEEEEQLQLQQQQKGDKAEMAVDEEEEEEEPMRSEAPMEL